MGEQKKNIIGNTSEIHMRYLVINFLVFKKILSIGCIDQVPLVTSNVNIRESWMKGILQTFCNYKVNLKS